jgi:formiminotetrahydrofolate cyclodeaminase
LEQSAIKLLNDFGSGGHVPGSGSAAALMGLLSAQLTRTVCKITVGGPAQSTKELQVLANQIETQFIPVLQAMFQEDADKFDEVIQTRRARDAETDLLVKRRHREKGLRQLEAATDLVVRIVELCLRLAEHAIVVFRQGASKVRGDSGGAISAAIAGASTGVFIAYLNLRSFSGGAWATAMQGRVNNLQNKIIDLQGTAFALAANLQPEDETQQLPLL